MSTGTSECLAALLLTLMMLDAPLAREIDSTNPISLVGKLRKNKETSSRASSQLMLAVGYGHRFPDAYNPLALRTGLPDDALLCKEKILASVHLTQRNVSYLIVLGSFSFFHMRSQEGDHCT